MNGKLSELAERHRSNAVLPGFAYSDEALFDLEVERLFRREWDQTVLRFQRIWSESLIGTEEAAARANGRP